MKSFGTLKFILLSLPSYSSSLFINRIVMPRASLFIFIYLLSLTIVVAQPDVMSVDQVNYEKRFIEAKREALLGNTERAIAQFEELIRDASDNDVAYYELGRLHFSQEDNEKAVEALEKAYELREVPTYARLLGEVYLATGRNKEGAKLYEKMVRRSPDVPEYYLQQALFLVRDQDIDGAVDVYNKLEKEIGVTPELSRRKHALYLGKGDRRRAEKELLKLIEAFPDNLDYRHLLAGFYTSQGDESAARKTYQAILRMEPADVKAQLAMSNGENTSAPGQEGELMALFGRSDVPVDIKIGKLLPLVQAVANTGDQSIAGEGLRLSEELRRVHPDEAKAWAITGDLYYHTDRYAMAADAYRETLERDDTVYPVWEQLLHALYLDDQHKELRDQAESALDVFPNRPYVYFYAALGEAARSDFSAAINLMEQAEFIFSAVNPSSGSVARGYLNILESLESGRLPEGGLPDLSPGPLADYLSARTALNEGNADDALGLLEAHDHPRNSNALLLELRGDVLRALNRKGDANGAYQRARAAGSVSRSLSTKISETRS